MEPLTAMKLSVSMARHQGSPDIKIIHISGFIANADSSSTPTDTLSSRINNTVCGNVVGIRNKVFAQDFFTPTDTGMSADSIQYAKPKLFQNLTGYARVPIISSSHGVRRMHDHGGNSLYLYISIQSKLPFMKSV